MSNINISGWKLPKTNAGIPKYEDSVVAGLVTTTNTTLAAMLIDTDAIDSSLNTIEDQSVLTASRLNNIQNKISANVDGTGDTLGQINSNILSKTAATATTLAAMLVDTDECNSSLNTIEDQSVLTASRLNNIQNKISANVDGTGDTLGQINSNILSKITDQETHLGNIDSHTGSIEGCVESNKVNVNISSGNISGFATSANQSTLIGHVDGLETLLTQLDVVADASLVKHANNEALLTSIQSKFDHNSSDLDHISDNLDTLNSSIGATTTAITALTTQNNGDLNDTIGKLDHISDNLDTLNTSIGALATQNNGDLNGAIGKLDHISDNLDTLENTLTSIEGKHDTNNSVFDAQLVKHTNNETLLTAISADGDAIQTLLTQLDVVADASLVKHTNNETLLTQLDVVADASLVKHTNNETLLTAISADGDAIQTLLTQLDVVADASLVKHTNNETLLTAVSQKLGDIETAVQLIDNCVSGNELQVDIVSGGGSATARLSIATGTSELAHNELVGSVDCSAFSDICIMYPTSQSSNKLRLFVKGATASDGTYHTFAQMTRKELISETDGSETTTYVWGTGSDQNHAEFIPCLYPHIKIQNISGTNFADSDAIRIVGK